MELYNKNTVQATFRGRKNVAALTLGINGRIALSKELVNIIGIENGTTVAFGVEDGALYLFPFCEDGFQIRLVRGGYAVFSNKSLAEIILEQIPTQLRSPSDRVYRMLVSKEIVQIGGLMGHAVITASARSLGEKNDNNEHD